MKRVFVLATALCAAAAAGCGKDPITPIAPELAFTGQFGGSWAGTMFLAPQGVAGGECVGADLRASSAGAPALDQGTISISQKAGELSAVSRSATTGLSCQFDGNAALASFALSAVSCDAEVFFQCSNGNTRVLNPVGSTMTAQQNGGTLSGVVTTTYNVSAVIVDSSGATQRIPVGELTVQQPFTAARR